MNVALILNSFPEISEKCLLNHIIGLIEAGVDVFSAKAMLLDPDCGLRMQSREAASGKLKNMVAAAGEVRAGYLA